MRVSITGAEDTNLERAAMYGMAGFIVPATDPDDVAVTVDVLWDRFVPKDADFAAGGFDLDTDAADANPEFEMGEPDLGGLLGDLVNSPKEIFSRRRMITFPKMPLGFERVSAAPDIYVPVDEFSAKVTKKYRAAMHSMVLFGVSSPVMTDTQAIGAMTIPSEFEWYMQTYLETVLEDAAKSIIGLTESGAETPYIEAMNYLGELLEDNAIEEGTLLVAMGWNVVAEFMFDVWVPGRFQVGGHIGSEGRG